MTDANKQNPLRVANLAVVPVWAEKLQKRGYYYEAIVKSNEVDGILELHKRETVTSYGTRRSIVARQSKSSIDENQKVYNRS